MLLKNVLKYNYGRFASIYFKKGKLLLQEGGLTAAALNGNCWCINESRANSSSPVLNVKDRFLKFSTVNFSSSSPVTPRSDQFFKRIDQIPENFSLIYKAAIDNYIVFGRRFTITCYLFLLGAGITKAFYLWSSSSSVPEVVPENIYMYESIVSADTSFLTFFLTMTFLSLSLQSALSKLPLRLYHNPTNDQYIAILSNGVGFPTKLSFQKGEIKKLKPSGFLPWRDNVFSIQSKKVILMEHYFRVPADYNTLIGIDTRDSFN